jgi:hypothetical protein
MATRTASGRLVKPRAAEATTRTVNMSGAKASCQPNEWFIRLTVTPAGAGGATTGWLIAAPSGSGRRAATSVTIGVTLSARMLTD